MGFFDLFKKKKKESGSVAASAEAKKAEPVIEEKPMLSDISLSGSLGSIDLSVSKDSVLEDFNKLKVLGPGPDDLYDSISNEQITKGNSILDTYEVVSDAIKGGMGSVWKVHHRSWNVDLAMKRPQPRFFAEGSARRKENFVRECEAWINLGLHPNIVSCYYVRDISGVPTIFSEWMENGSLENRISDGTLYQGTEQEQQARLLDIAIQFARGLHYAYVAGNGLIHQDVKPDNLLLTKDYEAKVADFGLARARAHMTGVLPEGGEGEEGAGSGPNTENGIDERDAGATHMAPSGGYTPAYCSREQLLGEKLTRRTDIYSWALSVLEMYQGKRPWKSGAEAGKDCETFFTGCRLPIPESLKVLLKQCLAEDPDARPHDFAVVAEELKKIYLETLGSNYPREDPEAAADTADSLNNRALSFLDLGKTEEAEQYWKDALAKTPEHLASIYNQALYEWRRNRIDDEEVLRRCAGSTQAKGTEGLAGRWYGQICGERGVFEEEPFGESRKLQQWDGLAKGRQPHIALDKDSSELYISLSRNPEGNEQADRNGGFTEGWRIDLGSMKKTLTVPEGVRFRVTPDKKHLTWLSEDEKSLYVADAVSGKILSHLNVGLEIRNYLVHPDGRHCFITAGDIDWSKRPPAHIGDSVQKWDLLTGKCVKTAPTPESLALLTYDADGRQRFSDDGRSFYQVSSNFLEWDTDTLQLKRSFKLYTNPMMISANARTLYEFNKRWDPSRTKTRRTPEGTKEEWIEFVSEVIDSTSGNKGGTIVWLSDDERRMLVTAGGSRIKLYDPETMHCYCTWFSSQKRISNALAAKDYSMIISCSYDDPGSVYIFRGQEEIAPAPWELSGARSFERTKSIQDESKQLAADIGEAIENNDIPKAVSLLYEAERTEGEEGSEMIRSLRRTLTQKVRPVRVEGVNAKAFVLADENNPLRCLALRPGSGSLAAASGLDRRRKVTLWESDLSPAGTLEYPLDGWSMHEAVFSSSGRYLAGMLVDSAFLWDMEHNDKAHNRFLKDIDLKGADKYPDFSPDERYLLVASKRSIKAPVYELPDCKWHAELDVSATAMGACYSKDGKQSYVIGYHGKLQIFDMDTYTCVNTVNIGKNIKTMTLDPTGEKLYFAVHLTDEILVWDTRTWTETDSFHTGRNRTLKIAFDPQNRVMATFTERDKSILLCSVADHSEIAVLHTSDDTVHGIAFSSDGCTLYGACGGFIRSWEIRWDLRGI